MSDSHVAFDRPSGAKPDMTPEETAARYKDIDAEIGERPYLTDEVSPIARKVIAGAAYPSVTVHRADTRQSPGVNRPLPESGKKVSIDTDRVLRTTLVSIIGVLALVMIGEIVFQLVIAPQLRLQRISLDSDVTMDQSEILSIAGLSASDPWYTLDPAEIERKLSAIPSVLSARVTKEFPDGIVIALRGRQPLVSALARTSDSRQVPVLIDEWGVAFRSGISAAPEGLPVLSGVEFRNYHDGLVLPKFVVPFLQDLSALRLNAPNLFKAFSEFRLVVVGEKEIEVLAYTMQYRVPVRISPRISQESALYALRSLDVLARTDSEDTVNEIDFRTNNVIYRRGEN